MRLSTAKTMAGFFFLWMLIGIWSAVAQTVNISPRTLYFGRISEGKTADREILIYNIGAKALVISQLRIEGADAASFAMIPNPGSVTLGIAQRLVLPIRFQPIMDGAFSARLVVQSNAATSPDYADLTGVATDLDKGVITFERIFGSPDGDGAASVHETADGGYIIAGSMVRLDEEYSDAALTKTDRYGQIEWRKWYGQEDWSEGFAAAIAVADGGYIAVGSHSYSRQYGMPDVYAVKTDAVGNLLWEKSYHKSDFREDVGADIIATADGGYLIGGYMQTASDKDAYLIKIDADGKVLWEKTYGGKGGDDIESVKQTGDGGYVFVGSTSTNATGGASDYDMYLVKVDGSGNLIWEKNYGGNDWDRAGGFAFTADGGYILCGYTASPEFGAVARSAYLVKLDAAGNKQWQKLYGWEHKDSASEVITTDDGGYLFVGSTERYYDAAFDTWRADLYIVKTDAVGNEQWSKTFGDVKDDGASFVRQTSDGGYIISGQTNSYSKDRCVYLIKLNRAGEFTSVRPSAAECPHIFSLEQNYPNPFNAGTTIVYRLPYDARVELDVYNVQGKKVRTLAGGFKQAGMHSVPFNADDLAGGLYFYRLKTDAWSETKRMLLLK